MSVQKILSVGGLRAKKSTNGMARDCSEKSDKDETEDVGTVVERAEATARDYQKVTLKKNSNMTPSKREHAQALHRQADLLHQKGDYEMALVLYYRAAKTYPRETSHAVAARRTAAVISSETNPKKNSRKVGARTKKVAQLAEISCPETAAWKAQKIVEESADPISAIDQILKYFDSRKDFSKDPPIFRNRSRSKLISKSRIMLRQLESVASLTLEKLQKAWALNDFPDCWKIGNELLTIAEALIDRYRYEVAARHYLAMTQIALGRHDRALDQATCMIHSAKKSADVSLRSRSFMTLGRVHLTFGHLQAAAKAWESLLRGIDEAIPRSWLLHEIGRCYLEMRQPERALETADRCLEYADEANSRKWQLHGQLLRGQALIEIGRLGEAVVILKRAHEITDPQSEKNIRNYISEAIDQVTGTLTRALVDDGEFQDLQSQDESKDENISQDLPRKSRSEDFNKLVESREFESWKQKTEKSALAYAYSRFSRKKIRSKDLGRISSRIWNCKAKMRKNIHSGTSTSSSDPEKVEGNILDDSKDSQDELLTSRTRVVEQNLEDSGDWIRDFFSRGHFRAEDASADEIEPSNRTGKTYVLEELSLISTEEK